MNSDFELTANAMAAAPRGITGLRVVPGSRYCDRPPTVEEYLDLVYPEDRQFTKKEFSGCWRTIADSTSPSESCGQMEKFVT